jgi:hypothetical protein
MAVFVYSIYTEIYCSSALFHSRHGLLKCQKPKNASL